MKREWSEREFRAFKEWEKRFDRPVWWMLLAAIGLPTIAVLFGALTK